jgi:hypothetical protein
MRRPSVANFWEKLLFGQINQNIRPLATKFGPSENILLEANIIGVFFSMIHNVKR